MSHAHQQDPERCRELCERLNAYMDGELAADMCRNLEQHMADCPDCHAVFDTLTKTIALYQTLDATPSDLPADVETRLFRRLHLNVS